MPFVFASNGRLFVEYDGFTGETRPPRLMTLFPTPEELRYRYERGMGFRLDDEAARGKKATPAFCGLITRRITSAIS